MDKWMDRHAWDNNNVDFYFVERLKNNIYCADSNMYVIDKESFKQVFIILSGT